MTYSNRNGVIRWQKKFPTSYLMTIVVLALSLAVCEIFANEEKLQNVNLENKGQGQRWEKLDLHHLTRNMQKFSYMITCVYAKSGRTYTYTHTYTHIARDRDDDYGQNLKADLHKKCYVKKTKKTLNICDILQAIFIKFVPKWSRCVWPSNSCNRSPSKCRSR